MTRRTCRNSLAGDTSDLPAVTFPSLTSLQLGFCEAPPHESLVNTLLAHSYLLRKLQLVVSHAPPAYSDIVLNGGMFIPEALSQLEEVDIAGFPNYMSILQAIHHHPHLYRLKFYHFFPQRQVQVRDHLKLTPFDLAESYFREYPLLISVNHLLQLGPTMSVVNQNPALQFLELQLCSPFVLREGFQKTLGVKHLVMNIMLPSKFSGLCNGLGSADNLMAVRHLPLQHTLLPREH